RTFGKFVESCIVWGLFALACTATASAGLCRIREDYVDPTRPNYFSVPLSRVGFGCNRKGYAVDRAVETLHSLGIRNAFINAGASTSAARGPPPGQAAWPVHLRDPSHKLHPHVMLTNATLSTSEQSAPSLLGRDSAGHIIDAATGKPLRTQFAVSVIAPT